MDTCPEDARPHGYPVVRKKTGKIDRSRCVESEKIQAEHGASR
jgi:hypothetical protein